MLEVPYNTLRPHDPRCTVFNTCGRVLYHYTSIETLGLILRHKTIRFNRLDRVNDLREALSVEYAAAQSLVFASCWTGSPDENLPLWKMYTELNGIRLALPTLMFNGRHNNHKVTRDDRLYELNVDGVPSNSAAFHIERRGEKYHTLAGSTVYGPTRMKYLDDKPLLRTRNVGSDGATVTLDVRTLGTVKHKHWQFEQEVRFRALAVFGYATSEFNHDWMTPEATVTTPVITEFVDIPLDPTAIDEANILLGPKVSSEQATVEDICSRYAPKARIERSAIKIR